MSGADPGYLSDLFHEDCPCDGCPYRADCAQGEACEAFAVFVNGGQWRGREYKPTRRRYGAVFREPVNGPTR